MDLTIAYADCQDSSRLSRQLQTVKKWNTVKTVAEGQDKYKLSTDAVSVRKVSYGIRKVSYGVRKVSDGGRKVSQV